MKPDTILTVITIVVVATVLIGEVYVYTIDQGRYSSEIRVTENGLEFSVTSGGSDHYSILVLDNGSFESIDKYYIYYDEGYGSKIENVGVPVGAKAFTQEYYISQLILMLEYRGITDVKVLDAVGLQKAFLSDIENNDVHKGLVVLSGALPDTIYEGNDNDTIFDWIGSGGSLYWAGNLLGAYYGKADGETVPVENFEDLFLGDCFNTGDTDVALSDIDSNGYRHTLSLSNSHVRYGIDVSRLPSGTDHLEIGYKEDGYSSIVMVGYGSGMLCVLGGDYSNEQRHDLAQIIASGICHLTTVDIAGYSEGDVKHGTVTGTIEIELIIGHNYSVYVYYGGYFPVYGRTTGLIK